VHGTTLAPEDGPRLAAARASLVWCPESDRRLYGTTAPVAALRAAGVSVGLGTDAPPAGARDALSNLAAARREGVLDDEALLRLATLDSAAVARLAPGGLEEGEPADLLAADSPERLLAGDRLGVALVVVRGEAVYGERALLSAAGRPVAPLSVDGAPRALAERLGRRFATILRRHPAARGASWLSGVGL
jgi:cytosine/adenosine deaminase-related metal-dependent hydrolase